MIPVPENAEAATIVAALNEVTMLLQEQVNIQKELLELVRPSLAGHWGNATMAMAAVTGGNAKRWQRQRAAYRAWDVEAGPGGGGGGGELRNRVTWRYGLAVNF
ncbi:hypothetical protein DL546_005640 [Coniochaeta pulveracea]|uniref:Uncharacterized protein n=1 Tax=Coniochaeta pulveracea TaxID=177199 RepID=A0A420Y379_9PEZI|nr:hypothetical protein DL546_005640 [Coniochaeta pulveracea]